MLKNESRNHRRFLGPQDKAGAPPGTRKFPWKSPGTLESRASLCLIYLAAVHRFGRTDDMMAFGVAPYFKEPSYPPKRELGQYIFWLLPELKKLYASGTGGKQLTPYIVGQRLRMMFIEVKRYPLPRDIEEAKRRVGTVMSQEHPKIHPLLQPMLPRLERLFLNKPGPYTFEEIRKAVA